jgi:hypothetical protein
MFDDPGVFYSNDPKTIFDDQWLLDQNKIHQLKQHNLSILDFSSEHYGANGLDHVYHELESLGVHFLLLSHHPVDHQKFERMFFYPYWYHWARKNFVLGKSSSTKVYKWSCLNGNPRNHRIYNYFYSKQQPYFDSAYFTFYNFNASRYDDVALSDDALNFWNNIRNSLPDRRQIYNRSRADSRCDLPAITDAYIHLVTETTVIPRLFVSEKTWKPIAAEQIFLVFGNPGTIEYLRSQGVDVFDDLIDHRYDSVDDWQQRLHMIHQQLKQLIDRDLEDIYIATLERRQRNSEKFFSGAFDPQYSQTIKQCINLLN